MPLEPADGEEVQGSQWAQGALSPEAALYEPAL